MFADVSWKNINYIRDRFQINFCFLFAFCAPFYLLLLVLSRNVDTKPSRDSVICFAFVVLERAYEKISSKKYHLKTSQRIFHTTGWKSVFILLLRRITMNVTAVTCHFNVLEVLKCADRLLFVYLHFWNVCDSFLVWLTFNELLEMNRLISDGVWKCKSVLFEHLYPWTTHEMQVYFWLKLVHVLLRGSLKIICFNSSECVIRLSCLFYLFFFRFYVLFHRFCSVIDMKQKRNNGYILFILVLTLVSISISCGMNRNRSNNNNEYKRQKMSPARYLRCPSNIICDQHSDSQYVSSCVRFCKSFFVVVYQSSFCFCAFVHL